MLEYLGERINHAIENSDYNKSSIADECGVSKQAVTGWINTSSISKKNLLKVSQLTKFRHEWLLEGTGEQLETHYPYNKDNQSTQKQEVNEPIYGNLTDKEKTLIETYRQGSKTIKERIINLNKIFFQLNEQQQIHILGSCQLLLTPGNHQANRSDKNKKTA